MDNSTPNTPGFAVQQPAYLETPVKIAQAVNTARLPQAQLMPSAVSNSVLGNVVTSSAAGLGAGTQAQVQIADSTSGVLTFTLTDDLDRTVLAVPDISWYIGSLSPGTQWPNSTYGMGNMPSSVWNDWGLSDNVNLVTRLIVRNNTGSSQLVIAVCRWRVIKNSTAQFEQGQVSGS